MRENKTYHVQVEIPRKAPKEYKQRSLQAARRQMGNELFDVLWQSKLPAVVDIEEEIIPHGDNYFQPTEIIRITTTVTVVQHMTDFPLTPYWSFSKNKIKRILQRWLAK